ncbi:MAG: hypothetical protein ABS01_00810 [Pelagibacteraceae bacterium BACL5 MAG-120705-bin12]|nr:MAG: hypothetical protein ABS01_00810 [Pelagibacteraceae bacterium BACL5 MAG-120705-bin12]
MSRLLFLISFLFLTNCSLNKNSEFWNEDMIIKKENEQKISKILEKSADITSMTVEEYELYIEEYTKKNKYPDISK